MGNFSNLVISKIIMHKVFAPKIGGEKVEPDIGKNLVELDRNGLNTIQNRIIDAMGQNAHCIEMEIEKTDSQSCFYKTCEIIDSESQEFINKASFYATHHYDIHSSSRWPGGILLIMNGTSGPENKKTIFIIKAETQEGFVEQKRNESLTMQHITNLFLTRQTKLYKIGIFVEKIDGSRNQKDATGFGAYLYDSNITASNDEAAAKYFYRDFLGLRIPENSKQKTRDFFLLTKDFINDSDIPIEKKIDLNNALYVYLKTDQSGTIEYSSFSGRYFDDDCLKDLYNQYMQNKNFSTGSIVKDVTLIKNKLKLRKMNFSSAVNISAPAEAFQDSIKVISSDEEKTVLEIKGTLLNQNV